MSPITIIYFLFHLADIFFNASFTKAFANVLVAITTSHSGLRDPLVRETLVVDVRRAINRARINRSHR